MINTEKLKQVIEAYKADFAEHFEEERYKWEAVKCFQDNWDINSEDFVGMLKNSFEKTYNLLGSMNYYPRRMIVGFAKDDSEATKNAFRMLFDESKDIRQRIQSFIDFADDRKQNHNPNKWKSHYQDCRAISAYLCLMYPTKYYFYKQSQYNDAKELIGFEQPKGFSAIDKLLKYYEICDEIYEVIKSDTELIDIVNEELYSNEKMNFALHLFVQDILYYHVQKVKNDGEDSTSLEVKNEIYINEKNIVNENNKVTYLSEIVAALKKLGGTATLSEIYIAIQERNLLPALKTNPTWKNTVRSEIQRHCSETKSFIEGNEELFYSVYGVNKGVWGLINFDPDEVVEENTSVNSIEKCESYTKKDFLNEVYITEKQYETLAALLKHKKNIILQGAPGVGKTFTAKRLAYSLMGEKDNSRIEFIQFHQSYSYEDFIMGYRPNDDGSFELRDGVFYRFCDKARNDPNRDYYFIIDEINRGNLSKIFGELLMLIEKDYRSDTVTLAYRDEKFSVPDNLYIIGMMNTADRSLAMIDYALRRRFSFFEMESGFDSDGFKVYSTGLNNERFNALIAQIKLLNNVIEKDNSLGKGFCIGHSYFCNLTAETCTDNRLRSVVEYDIIPMLHEYWFDDKDKADKWSENLRGIFNDD